MATFADQFIAMVTVNAGGAVKELKRFNGEVTQSTTSATKQLSKTEKMMGRVKIAAGVIGATAALHIGKFAVNASRDLTEAINAVNVMYGENADEVLHLSESAATGVGLSKRAFDEAAVSVGGFVNQIADIQGVGAAGVLDDLITRAADFGSVFNIDVDEALQRFRSGLAGETEPLRRFGINLLQSEVAAHALSTGLIQVGETMTEEQKVLARYELLMQKTNNMAGDFSNTSGDLANQQRILRAQTEDLAADLGDSLVPAAQGAVTALQGLVELLDDWQIPEALKGIAEFIFGDKTTLDEASSEFADKLERSLEKNLKPDQILDAFQPLRDSAKDGFGMIDVIDDWAFGDWFPGAKIKDTWLPAFEELTAQSADAGRQVESSLRAMAGQAIQGSESAKTALMEMGFSMFATGEQALEMADKMYEALPPVESVLGDLSLASALAARQSEAHTKAVKEQQQPLRAVNAKYDDLYVSLEDIEAQQKAATEATEAEIQALEDLFNLVDSRVQGLFNYEEAQHQMALAAIRFEEAQREVNEVVDDADTPINELEVAQRELRLEEIALAGQAYDTAAAFAEEQGAVEGSAEWARIMRERLIEQAEQYPYLRDEISRYILELARIPTGITTTVRTRYEGGLTRFAGGTNFAPGGLALVGEEGPELIDLPRGSKVHTAGQTARMTLPGQASMMNTATYNVSVNAGLGTNGAEVGRQVVEQIKKFERSNGSGWRS